MIMICHTNPYYLYDDGCDAEYGEYDREAVEWHEQHMIQSSYGFRLVNPPPRAVDVDWMNEFRDA